MNNNNNGYINVLDVITLLSYILQIQNSQEDKEYKNDIQQFEDMIKDEVSKMHKENNLILQKLDEIKEML